MGVFPLVWDGATDQFGQDETVLPGGSPVRGLHAKNPSTTPKWYDGKEDGGYRENLARLYIPISVTEQPQFLKSVAEISGDSDFLLLAEALLDKGYIDFFLSNATRVHTEKAEVIEHQAGGFVAYFFGAAAETYTFSGILINSCENDQAVNFYKIYKHIIRGTELARRRALVYLRYDSYFVGGTILGYQDAMASENELVMPFNFNMLVHKLIHRPRRGGLSFTPLQTECDPTDALKINSVVVQLKDNYEAAVVPFLSTPSAPPTAPAVDAATQAERDLKALSASQAFSVTTPPTMLVGSPSNWRGGVTPQQYSAWQQQQLALAGPQPTPAQPAGAPNPYSPYTPRGR